MTTQPQSFSMALSMSQMLLSANPAQGVVLTRELIAETLDRVLLLFPDLQSERQRTALIEELESRFSVFIGSYKVLGDDSDHVVWLAGKRDSVHWRHWGRYRVLLDKSGMSPAAVDRLDEVTDDVLGRLESPERVGSWSRRGIVVGHVQSGKTANYTGLICKAADAGYKLIIVLAGLHKNLRAQTQIRLDEGFLGYVSSPPQQGQSGIKQTGVGLIDPSVRPDSITNRRDNGDFQRQVANNFNVSPGGKPLLFVIKKNGSVLRNLLNWVESFAIPDADTGRQSVRDIPLLVIDDEADQASVDTNQIERNEDGQLDEDHDPAVINRLIRRLLRSFDQNAYVGYTATPFANIYIHEQAKTRQEGEDLFPRSFIINMPAPSNYFGPSRLFGREEALAIGTGAPPSLVRHVSDHIEDDEESGHPGWMPAGHKSTHVPVWNSERRVPDSLATAMHVFILASAARRSRGQEKQHHSMLVHVTRFTRVQQEVFEQIGRELADVRARWRNGDGDAEADLRKELRKLWEDDFVAVSREHANSSPHPQTWQEIEPHIWPALEKIRVRQINGTSADVLAYEEHRETGLSVIAVGGDKLSRGLTLEGLMVSYFLRSSRMYDTLMQMGRWFGYRPDYADLCRLYLTRELEDWYGHIAEASEELREQFEHMVTLGLTPRDYGLRVRSHPVLLVTSRVKSRHGMTLQLSYSGVVSETVAFSTETTVVHANVEATRRFLVSIGEPTERDVERKRDDAHERWPDSLLWTDVNASQVIEYLRKFATHPESPRANSELLRRYIAEQLQHQELTRWTVALLAGSGREIGIAGFAVRLTKRANKNANENKGYYRIGRLLSPKDEGIDLDEKQWTDALDATIRAYEAENDRSRKYPEIPSGPQMRQQRRPERGLLLLYLLDANEAGLAGSDPVVGLGISFPGSRTSVTVSYTVNNVYFEQEFGSAA